MRAVFVLPVGEQRRVAAIAAVEDAGLAEQLEPVAAGELVFQRRRVRAFDRDGRFRIFEVEQPVPQREVEKVALPDFEPVEVLLGNGLAALVEVLLELRDIADFLGGHGGGDGPDRGLGRASEVERADLGAARAAHVDGKLERRGRVLGDQLLGGFDGLLEARRMRPGQQGRLDHDHFLELHALAQHLRVVDHEPGEILVHQPDANEGVAFGQREDRVEACLFEAGRVKQREIEAGADLARKDVARTADHLA